MVMDKLIMRVRPTFRCFICIKTYTPVNKKIAKVALHFENYLAHGKIAI